MNPPEPEWRLAVQCYEEDTTTLQFHVARRPWSLLARYWLDRPGARLLNMARVDGCRFIDIGYPPPVAAAIVAEFNPTKLPIE